MIISNFRMKLLLDLLKSFDSILELYFECGQPQKLFDRLPDHCAVQLLTFGSAISEFVLLFKLQGFTCLRLNWSIDAETIHKVVEKLEFVSYFLFYYANKRVLIEINRQKQFEILLDLPPFSLIWRMKTTVYDLNDSIPQRNKINKVKSFNFKTILIEIYNWLSNQTFWNSKLDNFFVFKVPFLTLWETSTNGLAVPLN